MNAIKLVAAIAQGLAYSRNGLPVIARYLASVDSSQCRQRPSGVIAGILKLSSAMWTVQLRERSQGLMGIMMGILKLMSAMWLVQLAQRGHVERAANVRAVHGR